MISISGIRPNPSFFQAILFYLPRGLWLSLEGGLMKHLAKDKQGINLQLKALECYENNPYCISLLIKTYYRYYFYLFKNKLER